jgi:predicted DNA-binding transcriptional regulator AlpA
MATSKQSRIKQSVVDRIATFDDMPNSALLTVEELTALGFGSSATIWRDVNEKRLPAPISIGPNRRRFLVGWVRGRMKGGA